MRFKITQAVPSPFFSGIDTSAGAFAEPAMEVTEAVAVSGRADVDRDETKFNGSLPVEVAAA